MKNMIFMSVFIIWTLNSTCQISLEYFTENWQSTSEKNAFYKREIKQLEDSLYFVYDYSLDGIDEKEGYYKAVCPEVEHGKFKYTFRKINKVYKGDYLNGQLTGQWQVLDTTGILLRTLDYNFSVKYFNQTRMDTFNNYRNGLDEIHEDDDDDEINWTVPIFNGGIDSLMSFLEDKVTYPPRALFYNISGKVFTQFTVDSVGKVIDPIIKRSADKDLDKEAIRVVKLLKPWTPGEKNGEATSTKLNLPINFAIEE